MLQGTIEINGYAYKDSFDSLKEYFGSQLQINCLGYYVRFKDQNVLDVLFNNGVGDGTGVTMEHIKAVTNLHGWFNSNTNIVYFEELRYFSNVKTIIKYGFRSCVNLQSVDLSSINVLESRCFDGCSSLVSVGDVSELTNIDGAAFLYCSSLLNIGNMPKLTSIGGEAFNPCRSLVSIGDMPLLTSIGDRAFVSCNSLESIGDTPSLTSIGIGAFRDCWKLKHVYLTSNITLINNQTFYMCTALESVGDLSAVTSIGTGEFYKCESLTKLDFHVLTNIGESALNMSGLKTLIIRTGSVCQISTAGNGHKFLSSCLVYVPDALVDSYKSTAGWSSYPDSIKPLSEYTE